MIRNAVIHVINEQPLMADLFAVPSASDLTLVCTNLRTMNGKRPIFADRIESIFVFPYAHIRFVEIPPGAAGAPDGSTPAGDLAALAAGTSGNGHGTADLLPVAPPTPDPEPEADLEIDEDFLRRIREV